MTTKNVAPAPPPKFSRSQLRALRALRDRYQQHGDLFSPREEQHLQFLRWLYASGRLEP